MRQFLTETNDTAALARICRVDVLDTERGVNVPCLDKTGQTPPPALLSANCKLLSKTERSLLPEQVFWLLFFWSGGDAHFQGSAQSEMHFEIISKIYRLAGRGGIQAFSPFGPFLQPSLF